MFLRSALVDMYANCGSFHKAWRILYDLADSNAFVWNALLIGYIRNSCFYEALKCIDHMHIAGVIFDDVTHVCICKACGAIGTIDKGDELYNEICKEGHLGKNVILGSSLIDMFLRCGFLLKARQVFDNLLVQDVVTWTSLIKGYVEHGHGEHALLLYEQMQLEGVCPDPVAIICGLKACSDIGDIDRGSEMHHELEAKGLLEGDIVLGSSLVDMYSKCGFMSRARHVFDKFSSRNVVLWNTLISGYANYPRHGEEALQCFEQMKLEGFHPDHVSYSCILKACCWIGAVKKGTEIHADIARKELCEDDLVIGSTLVHLYGKSGLVVKAQEVFNKLVFRDVIAWTSLIEGYGEHGYSEKAVLCFEKMQVEGVAPNALAFMYSLRACAEMGALDKCQDIHVEVERRGLLESSFLIGSTLIDVYAKCGLLSKAQQVFDNLSRRDVISWTLLMMGYAYVGDYKHVFLIFERMIDDGIKPDSITFITVLSVCSRACLSCESESYFEVMTRDYGIVPSLVHHSCVINLLGRAGELAEAMNRVEKMQQCPNFTIWCFLLAACENWGNRKLGKKAFENALHANDEVFLGSVNYS
ncbi:hypothetical protein KP509_26G058400 [Ceratopteris richardii]|nr:hypothetical protein KP509_26G058400 [Ceratopteris richardii]